MAFRDRRHGVLGGGDLSSNTSADFATSDDGGRTWTLTTKPPVQGTIFCLAYIRGKRHGEHEDGGNNRNEYGDESDRAV
ncbi:MAG: hypothetical protein JO300_03595, partial [Silvibacterium sp.]|nr:hypothetical protein [Silvibacterium sp.]